MRIGELCETPCKHKGKVIWISADGKKVAVQCLEVHKRTVKKGLRNVVIKFKPIYLMEWENRGCAGASNNS